MIPTANFIERPQFHWTYKNIMWVAVAMGLASLAIGIWERYDIAALEAERAHRRAVVSDLQSHLNLLSQGDKAAEVLTQDKDVMDLYAKLWGSPKWSLVAGEIYASLPHGVVIGHLEKKADKTLRISGNAAHAQLLSYWLDSLKTQSTLESVQLVSTGERQGSKAGLAFELEVKLKGAV